MLLLMDLKSKACGKKLCMRAQNEVPSAQHDVKFSILIPCGKVCDTPDVGYSVNGYRNRAALQGRSGNRAYFRWDESIPCW